ncbi:MAG: hypothetical protein HY689_04025 [Chloroflexi bacterium]|nr:hypothetical protein [Chloroflexota bacterium]
MHVLRSPRGFLTKEAALRAILYRMERSPAYRPRGYAVGMAGILQAREHLEAWQELLEDYYGEGSA